MSSLPYQTYRKPFFLQVKSTDKPKGGWPVYTIPKDAGEMWQEKVKEYVALGNNFFYVFVELPTENKPEPAYYVVPSKEVAKVLIKLTQDSYGRNLKASGQLLCLGYGGLESETINKYQNKWELLFK